MRLSVPALAVSLALATAASAGVKKKPAEPAPALAPPPAATTAQPDDGRTRTVILGLQPRRGMDDKQLAAALTDVVQGVYSKDLGRIVIGRDDINRVLDLEADKQAMGCDSEKCLAEVGQALDARRIVTGSIDKIGDGFMVTMSEIDAKSLEPMARVQERVKNDENALVDAVSRLAGDLMQKAGSPTAGNATRVFGASGSIDIQSDPRGARIVLGGTDMGVTPTKIDNIATGTQRLRLLRDDYEPIEVDVPVYPGGVTKVNAEMRILRDLAQKNLEVRQAAWRDKNQWNTVGGWTKACLGGAGTACGLGWFAFSFGNGLADCGTLSSLALAAAGAGVLSWGIIDLATPPPAPVPEWEMERKVTVTPPQGQGDAQVHVIQEAPEKNGR